jgi:hypothetical protein
MTKPDMRVRSWIVSLAASVAAALCATAGVFAATPSPDRAVDRVQRFDGTVKVEGKVVRVAIDTWLIVNGRKIDALALPLRGQTVYELRGGTLFTVIAGRRQKRAAGELWALPASARSAFETGDDSAVLQTTVIAE